MLGEAFLTVWQKARPLVKRIPYPMIHLNFYALTCGRVIKLLSEATSSPDFAFPLCVLSDNQYGLGKSESYRLTRRVIYSCDKSVVTG